MELKRRNNYTSLHHQKRPRGQQQTALPYKPNVCHFHGRPELGGHPSILPTG